MASPVEALGAGDAAAVTKSDTEPNRFNALYIGGAGNVTIETRRGSTVEFPGVPAGTILPIGTEKVKAATTATNIVGLIY